MIVLKKKIRMSINVFGLLGLLFVCSVCVAQTSATDSTSSVSGHVTIGGKAAAGVVVLARITESPFENRTVARSVTDEEGDYHITGLTAGRFTITPVARAFLVSGNGKYEQPGQQVNVAQNESITKIDFALVRGGVITGRVTDPDGRPIIGEQISVAADSRGTDGYSATAFFSQSMYLTDDRGVYRVYGLGPGTYKVSVGRAGADASGTNIYGTGGSQYTKTFYPGVAEESKAASLEINEGAELLNIDITPGKTVRGFSVSGRVVDADSNQPVAKAFIAFSTVSGETQALGAMNFTGSQSDANGKFRLEGLDPGHYAAFTMSIGQENSYSDPAPFYISSGDVSGIEIKVRRGAIIEGVAVIENNTDPTAAALLQSISVYAYVSPGGSSPPAFSRSKINPDGSFQFTGLAPGKARVHVIGYPSPPKGLELARTEHLGQEQPNGIDVTSGARVTGVRLVFTYSTGKIRGELKIDGRDWPDNLPVMLAIHAVEGAPRPFSRSIEVDSRGRFVAENIPPGSYELRLQSTSDVPAFEPETRAITVANGVEVPVTIVINLAP